MQKINQLWYLCAVKKFTYPEKDDYEILKESIREQRYVLKEITIDYLQSEHRYPNKDEAFDGIHFYCKLIYEKVKPFDLNMEYFEVIKYRPEFIDQ